jgi:hypothetical protein
VRRPLQPNERWVLLLGGVIVIAGAFRLGLRGPQPLIDIAAFLGAGLLLLAGLALAWSRGLFGGSDD